MAALTLETAKLTAQQTITTAKADADAKRLAVSANNNLELRFSTWLDAQKAWAAAYGNQRPTPDTVVGSGGSTSSNQGLVDMMMVNMARQVSSKP